MILSNWNKRKLLSVVYSVNSFDSITCYVSLIEKCIIGNKEREEKTLNTKIPGNVSIHI